MGAIAKPIRTWDEYLLRYYLALLAAIKGHRTLCNAYQDMGEPETRMFLTEYYDDLSWMTNR